MEFALIMPALFLLVFGIINFGYLFGQQLALNQASRAGARAAVVVSNGEAAALTRVQEAAQGSLISNSTAISLQDPPIDGTNVASCGDGNYGKDLQIKVEYPTRALIPLFIPGFDTFTLKAEAVFRCEF